MILLRRGVALLGASGIVAQRFQQRLTNHPWFELVAVFGSESTRGKSLSEIHWKLPEERPNLPTIIIGECSIEDITSQLEELNCQLIFSALPSGVATDIEAPLRAAGFHVFSNSSHHRMDDDVPLVIADLNPHHLALAKSPAADTYSGSILCATNCTVVPIALTLKPIWDMIGFDRVSITTEQSLSGGGYATMNRFDDSGEFSKDIPGEAEKVGEECLRLLGRVSPTGVELADFSISVICSRVSRRYGHMVHVEVDLLGDVDMVEVREWIGNYRARAQALELPSAPEVPLLLVDDSIDLEEHLFAGGVSKNPTTDLRCGMAVVVKLDSLSGRTLRFSAYSENTLRGAAGGCVLLAELAIAEGIVP